MIIVRLPGHLRVLSGVSGEVPLNVLSPPTINIIIDVLEAEFPSLGGTVRDRSTRRRRPFIRFFIGEDDYSNYAPDEPLPYDRLEAGEPFAIIGAIAGG